jgi:periplasmic protein TonB
MPRELFGDVTDPSITLGSRRWYTVPLSLAAHTIALSIVVVIPLMATGVLPMPRSNNMFMLVEPPPLPVPPPVRPATPQATPQANPNAAPVVPPDGIIKEPDVVFEEPAAVDGGLDPILGNVVIGDSAIEPPPPPAPVKSQGPVRPGGDIRQPERIRYVAPVYPPLAMSARVHGMVIIEAIISTDGRVQGARVLRSDSPLLNQAALDAVREWTYSPTLLNGVPVAVIMTVTVHFKLQ